MYKIKLTNKLLTFALILAIFVIPGLIIGCGHSKKVALQSEKEVGEKSMTDEKSSHTSNGERIYRTATNDSGQKILFSDGPERFRKMEGSCVTCHGVNGKGGTKNLVVAPDITYPSLTGSEHNTHGHEHGHEGGATTYTDELIKRAITDGIGASGYELDKNMPRWKMSEKDLNDLLEYLRSLGAND